MTDYRVFAASLAAALAVTTASAVAAPAPATEATKLSSQYSDWAGGKSNADALIAGLRNGSSITIVTTGPNRNVSIAGFTPQSSMSYGSVGSALSGAQRSLSRMGITRPTAEQIQAALIGGEVTLPNGSTTPVRGTVAALGGEQGRVATR